MGYCLKAVGGKHDGTEIDMGKFYHPIDGDFVAVMEVHDHAYRDDEKFQMSTKDVLIYSWDPASQRLIFDQQETRSVYDSGDVPKEILNGKLRIGTAFQPCVVRIPADPK
jgi:hypothetical protein